MSVLRSDGEAVNYCVRSGELLGRMHFFKTSIQLRLIPAVMAERVKAASRVCTTKESRENSSKIREGSEKSKQLEGGVTHLSHVNGLNQKQEGTPRACLLTGRGSTVLSRSSLVSEGLRSTNIFQCSSRHPAPSAKPHLDLKAIVLLHVELRHLHAGF